MHGLRRGADPIGRCEVTRLILGSVLRPGDIMFGPIGGAVGVLVGAGQLILGDATPRSWKVRHVGVVTQSIGNGPGDRIVKLVQAMPSGAEEITLGPEHWTRDHVYIRPAYDFNLDSAFITARAARSYIGTPYSFLDYVALAGLHLGIRNGPVRRYVTSSKHMICSQLADQAMSDAGHHVFTDGRLPQDVTPAELFHGMLRMPGEYLQPTRFNRWRPCGPGTIVTEFGVER